MTVTGIDFDLVRQILSIVERHPFEDEPKNLEIEGYSKQDISNHVCYAFDADLLAASYLKQPGYIQWKPHYLTDGGYNFLNAASEDDLWESAKKFTNQMPGKVTLRKFQDCLEFVSIEHWKQ